MWQATDNVRLVSGGFCSGGLCTNLLLMTGVAGLFLNLARLNLSGFKKFNMKAGNTMDKVDQVCSRYGGKLEISRKSDMGELAQKLDKCFRKIKNPEKAFKGNPESLKILVDAHLKLKKMVNQQKKFFTGAYRALAWKAPALKQAKSLGKKGADAEAFAIGIVTGKLLTEELVSVEQLVMDIVGGLLEKLWGMEHEKHSHTREYQAIYKQLSDIRWRILGFVGEEVPKVLKLVLANKGIVPLIKQIFMDNALKAAAVAKGGVVKIANKAGMGNVIKKKVAALVNGALGKALPVAYSTVLKFSAKWKRNGQSIRSVGRKEYWDCTKPYEGSTVVKKVAPSIREVKVQADPKNDTSMVIYQDTTEFENRIDRLEETINMLYLALAGMALLLLLSWAYIALSCFYSRKSPKATRRPRNESVDLELGQGGNYPKITIEEPQHSSRNKKEYRMPKKALENSDGEDISLSLGPPANRSRTRSTDKRKRKNQVKSTRSRTPREQSGSRRY